MTTECMDKFKVDLSDDFRPRARTMSPSVLRKLRPTGNTGSPRVSSGRKPMRRHASVNSDSSSSEDLSSSPPQHNTPRPNNTRNNQSLLISILKRSKQNGEEGPLSNMEALSSSLPELSTDKYIDDCILRASQESLTYDREPLPKGSSTFESVMHELGSEEDVAQATAGEKQGKKNKKDGNKGQKQGKGKGKVQNVKSSPDVHSRRVHWSKN